LKVTSHAGQRGVSRQAGCIFRTLPCLVRGLHTFHPQFNAVLFAEAPGMEFEVVGRCLQAVVHMHCHHLAGPPLMGGEQQGGGIGPCAVGHRHFQR
jgi:hypothetical protein